MVFQLILGLSFFPLCSKQGPNPSLALLPLLSALLDKFLLSGKPFRFISRSSHAEIRAKSPAPSLNMCGSDAGEHSRAVFPCAGSAVVHLLHTPAWCRCATE